MNAHTGPVPASRAASGPASSTASTTAATTACSRLLIGPAAATSMKSRRPRRSRLTLTGTGFAQPMIGNPLNAASERQQDRPDRVDVHERVQRDAPEQPRRGIAEPVGGPGMRRLVDRERDEHDRERESYRQ